MRFLEFQRTRERERRENRVFALKAIIDIEEERKKSRRGYPVDGIRFANSSGIFRVSSRTVASLYFVQPQRRC